MRKLTHDQAQRQCQPGLPWRKLFKEGRLDDASGDNFKLLPVALAESPAATPKCRLEPATLTGTIELVVGKVQLSIDGKVDAAALALVLEHLLR